MRGREQRDGGQHAAGRGGRGGLGWRKEAGGLALSNNNDDNDGDNNNEHNMPQALGAVRGKCPTAEAELIISIPVLTESGGPSQSRGASEMGGGPGPEVPPHIGGPVASLPSLP